MSPQTSEPLITPGVHMLGSKLVLLALAMVCANTANHATKLSCQPTAEGSRSLVLSFYELALVDKHPRQAFEQHVAANFVEHKPDVPNGTRSAAVDFLEGVMKELPDAHWEILRTVAEKKLVFVHARFTPSPGAPAYAIADLFRIEDCTIVEHWDVVAPFRDGQPNPNSRF